MSTQITKRFSVVNLPSELCLSLLRFNHSNEFPKMIASKVGTKMVLLVSLMVLVASAVLAEYFRAKVFLKFFLCSCYEEVVHQLRSLNGRLR